MSTLWLAALIAGFVVLYVKVKEHILRTLEHEGGRIVPIWVSKMLREALGRYSNFVGVREVSIGGEGLACDRSRKYMIVWHPHGFITWVPFFIAGRYALDAQPCGEHWFPVVAPVLFRVPIFSEMLIILGARRVDKKVIDKMLARGDSIAIQPGGVKEQAQSSEKQEQAFFPARLGFVRMAIRHGVDLLPAYFFGENQLYKKVEGYQQPLARRFLATYPSCMDHPHTTFQNVFVSRRCILLCPCVDVGPATLETYSANPKVSFPPLLSHSLPIQGYLYSLQSLTSFPLWYVHIESTDSCFQIRDVVALRGMTLPIVTSRFGIPMGGLLPIPTPIHTRYGRPVPVGPPEPDPSDERVEEVFLKYLAELRRLFDEHAKDCLPYDVAQRGLRIVRLDGKPVPEDIR
ncbi:unnamed protein product [Durusdinium trenchii]|uniref:Acyltransferase n=1 Tax=Durusdinium trenchii TaxID=1381693 RepID=A0ABP0KV20_9DINO